MKRYTRPFAATLLTVILAFVLAACGSSSSSSTSSSAAAPGSSSSSSSASASGGAITLVSGTAPDSLDPQFGYTTQAAEADWISYTA